MGGGIEWLFKDSRHDCILTTSFGCFLHGVLNRMKKHK